MSELNKTSIFTTTAYGNGTDNEILAIAFELSQEVINKMVTIMDNQDLFDLQGGTNLSNLQVQIELSHIDFKVFEHNHEVAYVRDKLNNKLWKVISTDELEDLVNTFNLNEEFDYWDEVTYNLIFTAEYFWFRLDSGHGVNIESNEIPREFLKTIS